MLGSLHGVAEPDQVIDDAPIAELEAILPHQAPGKAAGSGVMSDRAGLIGRTVIAVVVLLFLAAGVYIALADGSPDCTHMPEVNKPLCKRR